MLCEKCGAELAENAIVCGACGCDLAGGVQAEAVADVKTSGYAKATLVLGILAVLCGITAISAIICEFIALVFALRILPILCGITTILTIVCGIVALVKISGSKGRLKGKGMAITGIVLTVIIMVVLSIIVMLRIKIMFQQMICVNSLEGLGCAMGVYAFNYDDKFPPSDQWCDLLIAEVDVSPKSFQCGSAAEGTFSYGLNKNLKGLSMDEVGPNVVMLFEIEGGRNVAGGPELLYTKRHSGEGCYILLTDGYAKFVKTADLPSLKWTVE